MAYDGSINIDSKIDSSGFSKGLSDLENITKSSLGVVTGILNGAASAFNAIAEKSKKSMVELRDEMEEGQLSTQNVAEAFQSATSQGGQFYSALENQSKTFNGQLSTLKDSVNSFLGELTKGLQNSLNGTAIPIVNGWMKQLQSAFQSGGIQNIVSAIGAYKNFSELVNNFDKATKAIKQFSDSGGLLNKVSSPLKTLGTDFKTLGGVATTIGSGIKDKFETIQIAGMLMGDKLKSLGPKISTAFSGIGSGISKVFGVIAAHPIIAVITAIVAGIIYLWNTNEGFREAVTNVWNAICGFFTNTIPAAWNALVAFFSGIPAWWNGLWTQVGQFFSNCWNGIIQFFTTTIPAWIASIGAWFAQLPYNIGFAIGQIIGFFINMGTSIWNWITVTLPQIITGIVQWFAQLPGQIWTWLCNAVAFIVQWGSDTYNAAVNAASSAISAVVNWFCQLPGNIWNFLCNAISCIGEWGSQTLSEATSWASQTISSIGDWFSQLPGNIWNWLCQVISDIGSWGSSLISQGADAAQGLFDAIVNTVQQIPEKMLSIGKDIVTGLWNGISGGAKWLWDKVSGFCGDIVKGFQKGFDSHSPSRRMAKEVGRWIPPGISVGMDKAMPNTISDMKSQISAMIDKAHATISAEQSKFGATFAATSNYQVIEGRSSQPYSIGGDTFNFYKPVETPQAHARALKYAKRELAYD